MRLPRRSLGLLAAASALSRPALAPAQELTEVRIGAPLALTGGLADEGKKQALAYQMWLDRVTAAGGMSIGGRKVPVRLITYDYQTDANRAQQLAERLITVDRCDVLTAPFGSGHTRIVASVAERYNIPVVASVASSESVFEGGNKWLFGTLAPNGGLTRSLVEQLTKAMPNVKRVAILGRDDVFPKSMADGMKAEAQSRRLEVAYADYYAVGTLDLSAPLARMRSLRPDWVCITGYTQDLVLARKQMADAGLHAPIVTMITGPAYREFTEGLGRLAEGVTSTTWWHWSTTFASDDVFGSTQAFNEEFRRRERGADPDYVHASAAAALVVVQQCIEEVGGTDRTRIRDALAAYDRTTFYGPVKFGPNGMNLGRDLPIIQVQGGQPRVLFPEAIRQASLIPMPRA